MGQTVPFSEIEDLAKRIYAYVCEETSYELPWHETGVELQSRFGASRVRVARAMHLLVERGQIDLLPGLGWYPAGVRPRTGIRP